MIKIHLNENVYISNIGYAILSQCPNKQSITIKDSTTKFKDDPFDALRSLFEPLPEAVAEQASQDITLSLIPSKYKVYTKSSNIKNSITLRVKVFFDKRQLSNLAVPINTTIEMLKRRIFEALGKNPNNFYKTRLFYPLLELLELDDNKFIWEYNIPQNGKVVMLTSQTFSFILPKQSIIKIKNQTLQKPGNQAYSTVISNVGWEKHGKYYWQVRIDKCQTEEDIFIGVCYKNIDTTSCPTHCKFWGILPLFAKKFSPNDVGNLINYGSIMRIGENIGVMITFINKLATISFYRNGISLGVAYQGIHGILYPAITMFGSNNNLVEVTFDPKAPMPFIN